jgi:uncharacterized protein YkwD
MFRLLSATLAISTICVAFTQPAHASSKTSAPSRKTVKASHAVKLTEKELRLVNAVNEYREERGLEPLKVDPTLMREARCAAPHFSHVIGGQWCWHRCRARGFRGWATDNIADGYSTPEDATQGWATSDGHARQMRGYFKINGKWRNYDFDRIGVGISGRKYIAIFGRGSTSRNRG